MAYTYTSLTEDQRRSVIDQRIRSYEADHFGHELNKIALESQPDSEEKSGAIADAEAAQATLEQAIEACKTALDSE